MTFSPTVAALLVVLGTAVGAFGTIVGSGGGFILTPILLLLYPHDRPATITAISLTAVFFNAASAPPPTPTSGESTTAAASASQPPRCQARSRAPWS